MRVSYIFFTNKSSSSTLLLRERRAAAVVVTILKHFSFRHRMQNFLKHFPLLLLHHRHHPKIDFFNFQAYYTQYYVCTIYTQHSCIAGKTLNFLICRITHHTVVSRYGMYIKIYFLFPKPFLLHSRHISIDIHPTPLLASAWNFCSHANKFTYILMNI